MDQPARRTTDADATSTNQSNVTHIFCGKLNVVQPATLAQPRNRQKAVEQRGFPSNPQSSHLPAWRSCRGPQIRGRGSRKPIFVKRSGGISQKRKTRPGGQPDGSSHMGALGVDGRSRRIQPRWGGITAPTVIVSREGRGTFKRTSDFFNFLAGDFGGKLLRGGPNGSANDRLVGRHGGRGLIQRAGRGSVRPVRNNFSSRPVRNRGYGRRRRGGHRRNRSIGIGFAGAEQVVASGGAEIAGGFHQDRADLVRLQGRIALQQQRGEAADIGGGKRGAGRHLIFFVRRGQENIDARS